MLQAGGGSAEGGIRESFFKEVEVELGRNPKGRGKAAPGGKPCMYTKPRGRDVLNLAINQ